MLSIRDIYKTYEGAPLLNGLSFDLAQGEIIALLGTSGSGKSTLLRIIAGLEKAESGAVYWDGVDLAQTPAHQRGFGLMFQDYALFPHRNVYENIVFGLRMQKRPEAEIEKIVGERLKSIRMESFAKRPVTELSGGEQQRVALARALAPDPRLLMLDEPLGALDRGLREELTKELRQTLRDSHKPVIYVTHDRQEAFGLADRLLILH
ncbi:MAG TPA: ABC transporter ATP-binding protein, partial [Anaerolineaceae bacterium]|nr:ABC transporter ATP-binding protein [Anaerolineaceae bacterium]